MPTTYTGDATSGLSPSAVPGPTTVPVITLPADGDADNAASVAQAFKQPANEIAWLKVPRSTGSAWTQALRTYETARGHIGAYLDHLAFPLGQFHAWDESWDHVGGWPNTSDETWNPHLGNGALASRGPSGVTTPVTPMYRTLKVSPSTLVATPTALARTLPTAIPTDDHCGTMKWSAILDAIGANRTTVAMGVVDATGGLAGAPIWGGWFFKGNGDTNWQCRVNGTIVDSGVAPVANTSQDFRIDFLGVNASDDVVGRVIFYINNVIVANITAIISTLATTTDDWVPAFSGITTTTGGAAVSLYVGPVKFRQMIFPNIGY